MAGDNSPQELPQLNEEAVEWLREFQRRYPWIAEATVDYAGSGDEGSVEDVVFVPDRSDGARELEWDCGVEMELQDFVDEQILSPGISQVSFNNEGGRGQVVIDFRKFSLRVTDFAFVTDEETIQDGTLTFEGLSADELPDAPRGGSE